MKPDCLKIYASAFETIVSGTGLSSATIRNYHQRIHALLSYCRDNEITCFDYDAAEKYGDHLNRRVSNGEIGVKYAGFLKSLAYEFADFISVPEGSYALMPHKVFVSSLNTLSMESKELVNSYAEDIRGRYAPSSVRGYLNRVAPFLHFLEDKSIQVGLLTPKDIRDYLVFASPSHPRSMNDVIFALRVFLRFLHSSGIIEWSVDLMTFRMPPIRKKVPVAYSAEEVGKILSEIDLTNATGKRDYAIIILSLYTGFRSVDIRFLKITDIDWERDSIHIVQHKTNRELITPLLPKVGNAIADYILNGRPDSDEPYVFLSHGSSNCGRQMGPGTIINRMRIYLYQSGVKKCGADGRDFHAIRKTFATNLLLSGTPLESVSNALGDAGMQAAKPYLALDDENLRQCCPDREKFPCRKEGLHA